MTQPVGPDFLLDDIFCGCKDVCDTGSCRCFIAQLSCSNNCGLCEGTIITLNQTEEIHSMRMINISPYWLNYNLNVIFTIHNFII